MQKIGIIGGGAWGTALATVAVRAGRNVTLYARDPAIVAAINRRHRNDARLPGIALDRAIAATADIAEAAAADVILLAVPAQTVRAVATAAAPSIRAGAPLVICAKGLERDTDRRMTEVIADVAPAALPAVLSGPSFAADVARGMPTAVTVGAADAELALALCHALGSATFRPYAETDLVGVEIGGAVKNVLAIAAGIVSGRGLGASALAALVARGFAELRRLADVLGARPDTLMGLSGLGDLVLTCSGPQSRNFSYGLSVGKGAAAAAHPLAEGIATAPVARDLARHRGVLMPIVEAVAAVLDGNLTVDSAIEGLMTRPLRHEAD
jgi:glycerol-3-phosphate dehydrogenase (NAD(P)+)